MTTKTDDVFALAMAKGAAENEAMVMAPEGHVASLVEEYAYPVAAPYAYEGHGAVWLNGNFAVVKNAEDGQHVLGLSGSLGGGTDAAGREFVLDTAVRVARSAS